MKTLDEKTIDDFGKQWTRFPANFGWLASQECFADHFGPLLSTEDLIGSYVADIGSGSGRIVQMLVSAGAGRVVAIEPSESFAILEGLFGESGGIVQLVKDGGEAVERFPNLDFVISFGVLHHIVDPSPVMRAAYKALRPGGTVVIWLYGREGNELYIRASGALRTVTKRLPDYMLSGIASLLNAALDIYIPLCRYLALPMRHYMLNHLGKVDRKMRRVTIFDQLNPAYAKYYREAEARELLEGAGFSNVRIYHRHGYSWTVIGSKR